MKALVDAGLLKDVSPEILKPKINALIDRLGDSDYDVRQASANTLKALVDAGLLKDVSPEILKPKINALIDRLGDSDWRVRQASANTLKALVDAGLLNLILPVSPDFYRTELFTSPFSDETRAILVSIYFLSSENLSFLNGNFLKYLPSILLYIFNDFSVNKTPPTNELLLSSVRQLQGQSDHETIATTSKLSSLLDSFSKVFHSKNSELEENRRLPEERFEKDLKPTALLLEVFLPGTLNHLTRGLEAGHFSPQSATRFLEPKQVFFSGQESTVQAFHDVFLSLSKRRGFKLDLTTSFKVLDLALAFMQAGYSQELLRIFQNFKESDSKSLAELALEMQKSFLTNLGKSFELPENSVTSLAYKKIYLPYLSRLHKAIRYLQDRKSSKLLLFKSLLKAMFQDRFWDFIEDESQEDGEGQKIAKHNKNIRRLIEEKGVDPEKWLGKIREQRMSDGHFMHYESSNQTAYDPIADIQTTVDYLLRTAKLPLNDDSRKLFIEMLSSVGLELSESANGKDHRLVLNKSKKEKTKQDVFDVLSFQKNLEIIKQAIQKLRISNDILSKKPFALETVTHLGERVNTLLDRLNIPQYVEATKNRRWFFSVRPILREPGHDLFIGDFTGCCLAMNSSQYPDAMMERLIDEGMNVIEVLDESTGKTMASAWLYLSEDGSLVIQNLEINAEYERNPALMNTVGEGMIGYAKGFAGYIGSKKLFIGIPDHGKFFGTDSNPGFVEKRYQKNKSSYRQDKIGGYLGEKYYLDSAGKEYAYLIWTPGAPLSNKEVSVIKPQGARLSNIIPISYGESPITEDKAIPFLAQVYASTRGQTGSLVIDHSVFSIEEKDNKIIFLAFGKEIFRGDKTRVQIVAKEGEKTAEVTLSMSDLKLFVQEAYKAIDEFPLNEPILKALNDKNAVAVIDLDHLAKNRNDSLNDLIEIAIPALIREAVRSHATPEGKNTVVLIHGNEVLLDAVDKELSGLKDRSFIVTDEKQLPEGYQDPKQRITITSPNEDVKEGVLYFFLQAIERGDVPNFHAALKIAFTLARIDKLEASSKELQEILRLFEFVLGRPIENKQELISVLQGQIQNSTTQALYALGNIVRIPIDKIIQGAKLTLQVIGRAA